MFVIGAEVLSRSLNALLLRRRFHPFELPVGCPAIMHLAYADDVVIFSSELKTSLQLVICILRDYCEVSRQMITIQKNCYLVHPNLPRQRRVLIGQVIGFHHKSFLIKYLGCPLFVGRRMMVYFADICNLMGSRIMSWKQRTLSPGARLS